jgi:hypothetical protein
MRVDVNYRHAIHLFLKYILGVMLIERQQKENDIVCCYFSVRSYYQPLLFYCHALHIYWAHENFKTDFTV